MAMERRAGRALIAVLTSLAILSRSLAYSDFEDELDAPSAKYYSSEGGDDSDEFDFDDDYDVEMEAPSPRELWSCGDAGIRCRIPQKNWGGTVKEQQCNVGGSAGGQVVGGVAKGTASVNGNCYWKTTEKDSAVYLAVGVTSVGQCYNPFQGGCQPQNCPNNDASKRCNERIADCTVYPNRKVVCGRQYAVKKGDDCSKIANANGMTLKDLQGLNKNVACSNLQINQKLCLAMTEVKGQGKHVCEGYKFNG